MWLSLPHTLLFETVGTGSLVVRRRERCTLVISNQHKNTFGVIQTGFVVLLALKFSTHTHYAHGCPELPVEGHLCSGSKVIQ